MKHKFLGAVCALCTLVTFVAFLVMVSTFVGCEGGKSKPCFHLDCYVDGSTIVVDVETVRHGFTILTCEELGLSETFSEDSTFEFPVSPGTYTFVTEYVHISENAFDVSPFSGTPDNVCVVEIEEPVVDDDPEDPEDPEWPPLDDVPCWETDPPNRWGHRKVAVCVDGRTRLLTIPAACNLTQQGKATWGVCEEED